MAWVRREPAPPSAVATAPPAPIRLPVQIVSPGRPPEWKEVEVPAAIPEPGVLPLALLTGLLLLRRKR